MFQIRLLYVSPVIDSPGRLVLRYVDSHRYCLASSVARTDLTFLLSATIVPSLYGTISSSVVLVGTLEVESPVKSTGFALAPKGLQCDHLKHIPLGVSPPSPALLKSI